MKVDIIIIIVMVEIEMGMILDLNRIPIRINIITGLDPIHTSHRHYLIDTRPLPPIHTTINKLTVTVIKVVFKCLINIICLI
jgi:hypothetical protein